MPSHKRLLKRLVQFERIAELRGKKIQARR